MCNFVKHILEKKEANIGVQESLPLYLTMSIGEIFKKSSIEQ